MSDRKLKLTAATDNFEATVEIVDDAGPLNTWLSKTAGAWSSDRGTFVNSDNTGHAKGCGAIDCWTLHKFDFDENGPGDSGKGINADASGDFPVGNLTWVVIA